MKNCENCHKPLPLTNILAIKPFSNSLSCSNCGTRYSLNKLKQQKFGALYSGAGGFLFGFAALLFVLLNFEFALPIFGLATIGVLAILLLWAKAIREQLQPEQPLSA